MDVIYAVSMCDVPVVCMLGGDRGLELLKKACELGL